ncbi:hypothetical protein NXT08_22515 [Rhodococcus pyridinivorans]|uniref:hypothetical protein n=1 Tax=Rhodococcus pyridinivorans TaxID=103816 RepID=UPI0021641182|nr:hypothetical protein [Rhodococcus pyridinivorans]UVT24978.1 hypothetical protein NXT08_22515 [Rhodococcus pyridinivorans]
MYVRHLPRDSALAIDDNGGLMPWSMVEHLLADRWEQEANRGRKKGTPPVRNPRRLELQSKQMAQRGSRKRAAFERAKARREKALRARS